MKRSTLATATVLTCLSLHLFAEDPHVARQRAETVAKADKVFGRRHTPASDRPLRFHDKQKETGPPDSVIYWHGASYVVELVFAADGTVARLQLHPEALLYSDDWDAAPSAAKLSNADMQWFVTIANALQPLGKPRNLVEAPHGCFQSGRNLYCTDIYDLASVSHYHVETKGVKQVTQVILKEIGISYRQSLSGTVEDVREEGTQRQLKVGGQWYHGEKPGVELFEKSQKGSMVQLVTWAALQTKGSA